MNFYPATTHAYNAGYDDGFFDNTKRAYTTNRETVEYERGYAAGVHFRPAVELREFAKSLLPKPRVKKAKAK